MDAAEKFGVFGAGMTLVLEGCAYRDAISVNESMSDSLLRYVPLTRPTASTRLSLSPGAVPPVSCPSGPARLAPSFSRPDPLKSGSGLGLRIFVRVRSND